MRLFYAVLFDTDVKQKLSEIQKVLRENTLRGNFTLYDNLHLTLAFIGEVSTSRAKALLQIARSLEVTPFELRFNGLGRFKRDGGDILWAGVEENRNLASLYRRLCESLKSAGFEIEKRKYTPHLTLAREVRFREGFSLSDFSRSLNPIGTIVTGFCLMKSERVNGRLTYTEVK